jgi:hypothetical protein
MSSEDRPMPLDDLGGTNSFNASVHTVTNPDYLMATFGTHLSRLAGVLALRANSPSNSL